ncbi:MAG: DUF6316 family protein [Pseudomonadota bacterium]
MKKVNRNNEQPKTWFRSERVFMVGKHWYFQTREGIDVGPYETQFEAEIEAGLLKELLRDLPDEEAILAAIREFVLDSFSMGRPLSPHFRTEHQSRTVMGA